MKTSATTTTFPRIGLVGTFAALTATLLSLLLVATWAHAKHVSWSAAGDVTLAVIVGVTVWAAKRQVLRLRNRGRNAASGGNRA